MSGHGDSTKGGAGGAGRQPGDRRAWPRGWRPGSPFRRDKGETVHSLADCGNQVLLLVGMETGEAPAVAGASAGAQQNLFLVVPGRGDAVHHRRHVFAVRRPASWPTRNPLENWQWAVGVLLSSRSRWRRTPPMPAYGKPQRAADRSLWRWFRENTQRQVDRGGRREHRRLLGLTVALALHRAQHRHRQPAVGCGRHPGDRRAAGGGGGVRGDRGQGDAGGAGIDPRRQEMRRFLQARPRSPRSTA